MLRSLRWFRTLLLVLAAFLGGAVTAHLGHASGEQDSPYAPLAQLARVLVVVENQYVDPVERAHMIDGATRGLVAELDPHSAYMTPTEFAQFNEDTEGSFGGIGVEVDFKDEYAVVIAPIPGGPAARAGILSGDKILAVDGRMLRGLKIDKIVQLMRGPPKTPVRLTIKRDDIEEPFSVDLFREHIHVPSIDQKRFIGDVGYLRLKQFQEGAHGELLEAIALIRKASPNPLAGILLDLRNNPGGLIDEAEAIADELLDGGAIYSTRHRGRVIDEARAHSGGALTRLPAVVLVNEYSASSSELVAGALQDHQRAVIVGAPTFGKGSVQTIFELAGGAGMRLTTMRYYTPNGRAIQVAGIQPDVVVTHSDDARTPLPVLREDSLEGHLPAEGALPNAGGKVLAGGKRPQYVPIEQLGSDPLKGDDVALAEAYRIVRKAIEGQQP